ncbi:multifunctional oxoglutarate decarboxylase/oxoglutarate dehydrogenase thiamine pyrophosphate-binding subunit/dihydrolipoyllysine-residue succinyltransferase subunit, partial [Jatrophihabitans sp.]|uniref:multifunctional oxoglutarate decarboxylase/oxoglutarate dehydrogenase thiamine pyrophosphate-binding subunit/dihydrolipoyllysine-residue succinyltransferase subunit n=1 Tax=Jatrophihabitans sp. TaxID=1932789 RepID=UPI002BC39C9B|nr:multifunctional oxoglutarate decarboxylase/oxoglutarate dehydrogenase thiamine pyrophosphate-binding subunit/dihydrolipoyllysine-residue succinyltransferase subunit [Jatrophihabitans sp.]
MADDVTAQSSTGSESTRPDFGANEWLVEEMYERYLADPSAVDAAWHDFFADYRPAAGPANSVRQAPSTGAGDDEEEDEPQAGVAPAAAQNGHAATDGTSGTASTTAAEPAAPQADSQQATAQPAKAESPKTEPAKAEPAKTEPAKGESQPAQDKPAPSQPAQATPAASQPASTQPAAKPSSTSPAVPSGAQVSVLRGAPARVVSNMQASLEIPTATSVRAVPAKLLADNRIIINNHLRRARGGKVSFTHLIGYAVVRALRDYPEMNNHFAVNADGKPTVVRPEHVNLGLAIDLPGKDGGRSLVVASIKSAEEMDFASFWGAYEDIIRRARSGKLAADDFAGTTVSLTNPGTIGTNHSVPRLMAGQGTIIGVGAMEYPAEFSGMNPDALNDMGISRTMTLTSTYDHRIIQGAQSGEFLRRIHQLLLGEDNFYYDIFGSLRIPYEPAIWLTDREFSHEGQIDKGARVIELINAYRTSGHLMADTDPLEFKIRTHPDLDITKHGLTLWDLDREFAVGGFAGQKLMRLRDILGVLRDAYCRRVGVEYMHIIDPEERAWIQQNIEVKNDALSREEQKHILSRLNVAEAFETFLQTKYVGQKRFSLEGGETVIALLDAVLAAAAGYSLDEVVIGMPHRGRLNVLANIVGKPYAKIFNEFEGNIDPGTAQGSGDVKYHLGAHGTYVAPDGTE